MQGPPQSITNALQHMHACAPGLDLAAATPGYAAVQLLPLVEIPAGISGLCVEGSEYRSLVQDSVAELACTLQGPSAPPQQPLPVAYPSSIIAFTVLPPSDRSEQPAGAWKIWATAAGAGVASLAALTIAAPLFLRAWRRVAAQRAHWNSRADAFDVSQSSNDTSASEELSLESGEAGVSIQSGRSSSSGTATDISGSESSQLSRRRGASSASAGWRLSGSGTLGSGSRSDSGS
jgi:hypothetical protein